MIAQGEGLGIFTWMLFSGEQPQELLPLAFEHPDSAFLLFCAPSDVTPPFWEYAAELDNLMTVVRYDEGASDACELLRGLGLLYSLYFPYTPDDVERITSGELLYSAQQQHPVFTALLAGPGCSAAAQTQVHQYVELARSQQLGKAIYIILQLCETLIGGEERIQTSLRKNSLQQHMGKQLRMSNAVKAAFFYGKTIRFPWLLLGAIWYKGRNQRVTGLKGFSKPLKVIRLSVIIPLQRTDI